MVDVYRVGIAISMQNGVSGALRIIQRDLLGLNHQVDLTQGKFDRLKMAVIGAGAALGGAAILGAVGKLVDAGGELVHQQERMKNMGLSNLDVARATAAAWKETSANQNSTVVGNLKNIADLRYVLGSLPEAMAALPRFADMQTVMDAAGLKGGGDQVFAAVKAMEQSGGLVDPKTGKIDPQRALGLMDLMTKVDVATQGRVNPTEILNFMKQAGPAASLLSPDAMYGTMPSVIQAMGGYRAGTALQAITRQFTGGIMTESRARELEQLGLLDAHKVQVGRGGHLTIGTGAVTNGASLQSDTVSWTANTLIPALVAHGYKTTDQQIAEIYRMFGTAPEIRAFADMIRNLPAIMKDAGLTHTAVGAEQGANELNTNDRETIQGNFAKQFHDLMIALGVPLVPIATAAPRNVTSAVNYLATSVAAHPEVTKMIVGGLAGIGAGLLALGVVMTGAAIVGLVGTGGILAALGIGFAAVAAVLVAVNWKELTTGFDAAVTGVEHGIQRLIYDLVHPSNLLPDLKPADHPHMHMITTGKGSAWTPDAGYMMQNGVAVPAPPPPSPSPAAQHMAPGHALSEAMNKTMTSLKNWIELGAPVQVSNTQQLGNSIKTGLAGSASAPQSGTSGFNPRVSPVGTPTFATH